VVNSLAAIGFMVFSKDHINVILDGLPEEYDEFITSITFRLDSYTIEDIETLLLAQEDRFEKHKFLDHSLAHVNFTSTNWGHVSSSKPFFLENYFRGGRGSSRMYSNNKRQIFSLAPLTTIRGLALFPLRLNSFVFNINYASNLHYTVG